MFKSSKKLEEPPKVMTMEDIQEDLETFCKVESKPNRSLIIDDMKLKEGDFLNLTLNQWLEIFDVNSMQVDEFQHLDSRLNEIKQHLIVNGSEDLQNRRKALLKEIDENLKRLRLLKAPK